MSRQSSDPNRLVTVFENIDASLVWIARDELASVGVEGFIFDENLSRITSRFASLFPVRLRVYADKVDVSACAIWASTNRDSFPSLRYPLYGTPVVHYLEVETRRLLSAA